MKAEADKIVQVEYEVPVSAFVNVETGEVEKVCVWDEEVRPFPSMNEPPDVVKGDYSGPVTKEITEKAREIAEQKDWPAWQFGH